MQQLTVRDVPDDVMDALREAAEERGHSVNAVARAALAEYAAQRRWRHRLTSRLPAMDALRARIAARHGGPLDDSAGLIGADREPIRSAQDGR